MINFKDLLIYGPIIGVGGGGGGGVTIKNQNKTITENGTYTADSGYTGLGRVEVNVQGGGATVSVDGENWADGTAVPSDGFIENVYVNTALSNEQVTEILSRLTYYPMNSYHGFDGDILFINNNRVGLFVERQYTGVIRLYGHCQSTNTDDMYGLLWDNEDGWNQAFVNEHNSTMVVNDTVSTSNVAEALNWTNYYEYTGTVGTQNALLTQLFSTTPFVKEQKTIQLTGNYDGSTIKASGTVDVEAMLEEKKLPLKIEVSGGGASVYKVLSWKGTAVPNEGEVGTIYINNQLSVQQVLDIAQTVLLQEKENNNIEDSYISIPIITNENCSIGVMIEGAFDENNNLIYCHIGRFEDNVETDEYVDYYWFEYDAEYPEDYPGWLPDVTDFSFPFNNIAIPELIFSETERYILGQYNNQLSSLFSTTPFEVDEKETIMELSGEYDSEPVAVTKKETIDIKTLLEQKKLPLEIVLKFGSDKLQWGDYGSAVYTIQGDTCYILDCADSLGQLGGGPWKNEEIKKVVILEGTRFIHKNMFMECTNLTNITIPYGVTAIGGDEFVGAFRGCTGLTSITIPDSVTSIGNNAFRDCTGLTSITIPDSVTSIGLNSLDWTGKTSITCPLSTLEQIADGVFLKSDKIIITSGDSISERLFAWAKLTSITLPNTITNIGNSAFEYCTNLTEIVYNGTIEQWNAITKGTDWNTGTGNYTIQCTITTTYPKA